LEWNDDAIDEDQAPHPPACEHARHHQRQQSDLPSPSVEEVAHDLLSFGGNGFPEFIWSRVSVLRSEQKFGDDSDNQPSDWEKSELDCLCHGFFKSTVTAIWAKEFGK